MSVSRHATAPNTDPNTATIETPFKQIASLLARPPRWVAARWSHGD